MINHHGMLFNILLGKLYMVVELQMILIEDY
jgi:hypothetical protein